MKKHVVIVGAGHGGFCLASSLRALNFDGHVTLLSDEADYPYHRPPLSKAFMSGNPAEAQERLYLEAPGFYDEKQISLRLNARATALEVDNHRLHLDDGETLNYDYLVLATGARARKPAIPGIDLEGVESLRTLDDARRIRQRLEQCKSVVVVGGGFIGLELAATARQLGKQVTVLESAPRIMARSVAPGTSAYIARKHRETGIVIDLDAHVQSIAGREGKAVAVQTQAGQWPADLIIVGAGAEPRTELAQAAGIACGQGIEVDHRLRTSAPDVYAIGDCAAHFNAYAGPDRVRLESIQNANDQARTVAQVLTGSEARYEAAPWFWTDQGEVKLQMVGLSIGATEHVLRGDIESGKFSVFHYRGDTLLAVDSINQPLEHIMSRKLLTQRISPDKAIIADTAVALKSLL
jgi:3-phenylpropionate/trans-cinnamate dioxygenase ferredoxin reductase subunit